jgi:hypothetical protein
MSPASRVTSWTIFVASRSAAANGAATAWNPWGAVSCHEHGRERQQKDGAKSKTELQTCPEETFACAVIFDERAHVCPPPHADADADVPVGAPAVVDVDAPAKTDGAQSVDDSRQQRLGARPVFAPEPALAGIEQRQVMLGNSEGASAATFVSAIGC